DQIGFKDPTPVQEQAIPLLLSKDPTDFIGLAQTGTGKTAAFGLPLIDLIDVQKKETQVLIMAPTRELGQQTAIYLKDFSRNNTDLNVVVVYGGAAIVNQIKALRKPTQIVVATPGRLLDLIKRKAIRLDAVKYVVLNMGFKEDIDKILSYTREDRVTWLFSATMPPDIRKITKKYMKSPVEISVNTEERVNKNIVHKYVITKTSNKIPALCRFLDLQPDIRGILFCRTKRETQKIADDLANKGYEVEALHGDLSQAQRDAVMKRFKSKSMQLLVATDVAARGIDVSNLSHVFHHSLPDQLEGYTHRSGRTARAGKKGISLVFINPREGKRITELERKSKIQFEKIEVPNVGEMKTIRLNNWATDLVNMEIGDSAGDVLQDLQGQFAHLSKEDLLKKLITTQLRNMGGQNGEAKNLNESQGDSNNRREGKGNKPDKRSNANRYFINIGLVDGLTKHELVQFLADVTEINRKHFRELSLQKNCAYFDVENGQDNGFSDKFRGIEIEGREVRVNRDKNRPQGGGKWSGGYKGENQSGGGRRSAKSKYSGNRHSKSSKGGFEKSRRRG
ncbi:MAG: DEAD/DEAH box helicase, partial [Bacteroidetes bacterium]|nr:DEAD/DEAH box helicase [Bacteroidota bacterium]